jgi:lantibiotic biosynthesis protein
MKEWQAIAADDLSARLMQKLAEIAAVLRAMKGPPENPGLLGGTTGVALFFSYYARFSGAETDSDLAFDLFSDIFDMVNSGFDLHTFATGLAGIG